MKKTESIVEIAKALNEFHKVVEQPAKSAANPFFKSSYVPLEDVVEAIVKACEGVGLSFTQWAVTDDAGMVGVATLLMHESGEWIEYPPVMIRPSKADPQQLGSAITYLKRYTLSAVFGITSDKDDDGEGAMARNSKGQPQRVVMTSDQKNELFQLYKAKMESLSRPVNDQKIIEFINSQEAGGYAFPAVKAYIAKMK